MRPEAVRACVHEVYEAVGRRGSRSPGHLGIATGATLARDLGYPDDFLSWVPPSVAEAFVGSAALGPLAGAEPGEIVLDLGCGAGLDSLFLARRGCTVWAVDFAPAMLCRLRAAAAALDLGSVLALQAAAPQLPLATGRCARVLMNGVANLVPDRPQLLREAHRVLQPAGRLLLADLLAIETLPGHLQATPEAWAWCVAGAALPAEWRRDLQAAGFGQVAIEILEEIPPLTRGVVSAVRV